MYLITIILKLRSILMINSFVIIPIKIENVIVKTFRLLRF